MADVLAGFSRETMKSQGGTYTVHIALLPSITGVTSASSGVLTFHCGASAFKHFVLSKESGSVFTSTEAGNVANGTVQYEQVFVANFRRNQVAKRNEMKVLGRNELVMIINDNDIPSTGGTVGNLYAVGFVVDNDFGGVDTTAGVITTGGQFADANSMQITLRALESHPPLSITAADYAKVVAGTAV